MSSSSKSQKEFDGASVASTSTFSSTVSLLKSVKDKLHRETPGKMTKEQKKQLQQEQRREEKANGPVQWIPDINGDDKTREFLYSKVKLRE